MTNPLRTRCIGVTYAIVVMTRRGSCVKLNADYTLARVPSIRCLSSSSSSSFLLFIFLLVYSFFSVCSLRVSTSTTQSRGSRPRGKHEPRGEDVLRNRWPLSNIFLPASLALTIARAMYMPAGTCPGEIPGATSRPTDGNHLPLHRGETKIHQSPSITEN